MKRSTLSRWVGRTAACATVVAWAVGTSATSAFAETAREKLRQAEDYFLVADYEGAIARIDELIESKDLSGNERRDAWVLRARCNTGLGRNQASTDFCSAMRLDPAWRPNATTFTDQEMRAFQLAEKDCGPKSDASYLPPAMSSGTPWYKKKLVLGALVGVAAGATVIALSGGDDGEAGRPLLPEFPGSPNR
jgi:hypothetical protein